MKSMWSSRPPRAKAYLSFAPSLSRPHSIPLTKHKNGLGTEQRTKAKLFSLLRRISSDRRFRLKVLDDRSSRSRLPLLRLKRYPGRLSVPGSVSPTSPIWNRRNERKEESL